MKTARLSVISTLVGSALFLASSLAFSQVASSNRIPQQVVINGQTVNAVSVIASSGSLQRYSCLNPQQYTTSDGASQGWACYDSSTGVWLLNALPPAQTQAPQPQAQGPQVAQPQVQQAPVPQPQVVYPQPQVAYPQPAPTVVYQQPPAVIYQPATVVYPQPATVIYQPAPAVIYQQPATVIYTAPVHPRTVVVGPVYPPSVFLGTAAINAAGRIASAAIIAHGHERVRYVTERRDHDRVWRR
jgi:hypothetical protein